VATKETIAKAMRLLYANWPDQQRGKATAELYYQMLKDLPDATIAAAVRQRIAESNPFFPRVGEIRQLAIDIASGADEVMPAPEAWGKLLRWIRRYGGGYQFWDAKGPHDPPGLPPLVKKAADAIGGVDYIGMSENLVADRARFIEAYQIYVQRARARVGMLPEVKEARRAMIDQRSRLLRGGPRDDYEQMMAEERAAAFDTVDGDGD